ncbi:hypothetical protein [Limosilactobacillus reuteri]|uniref:Uncharacterized protein n=1 Tax=Limosilactobacillus reuteri TaxID=1598 RepID=A0AB36AHT8_LIMRT|nr:hypothetical protein [Limosilactobacillus reuteri]MCC4357999.1 hypothetical protein [Limosilactobacillus reuteri]MCC4363042.1 hypothetical protein [Limosilactobacillus reuteri]MCC4365161.1 hypothetical protein [Limosilactobacillus reuteri]MCH5357808.1 hypothetical protein [Limosilactobacillus reuteri]MRG84428.1 hypothetical protein [Limosilactobacillus reuteri]
MTNKNSNIAVDNNVKYSIKALALVTGHKTIREYMRHLAEYQAKHLSASEYEDYRRFMRYYELQEKMRKN